MHKGYLVYLAILFVLYWRNVKSQCGNCTGYCDGDSVCFPKIEWGSFVANYTEEMSGNEVLVAGENITLVFDNDVGTTVAITDFRQHYIHMYFSNNEYIRYCELEAGSELDSMQMELGFVGSGDSVTGLWSGTVWTARDFDEGTNDLEVYTDHIIFDFYSVSGDSTVREVRCYGNDNSPEPTTAPSLAPTLPTMQPSVSPTVDPTLEPTLSPTAHPTPDVCDIQFTVQPCCGTRGYAVTDERVNLRGFHDNCTHFEEGKCCGNDTTLLAWTLASDGNQTWACNDGGGPDFDNPRLCDGDFYYITQDNFTWFPVNGTLLNLTEHFVNYDCDCRYEFWTCTGEDGAVCNEESDYEMLEMLFGNDTDWYNVSTWINNTNITDQMRAENYSDEDIASFAWEPCSFDTFVGEVSDIIAHSGLDIDQGDCKCLFEIEVCGKLPDTSIFSDECLEEAIVPCCDGESVGYESDLDGNPTRWYCPSTMESDDLCPDIYDSNYAFTTTYHLEWWYDADVSGNTALCECSYIRDVCNVPTSAPSMFPSRTPSGNPSATPTDNPTPTDGGPGGSDDDDDDGGSPADDEGDDDSDDAFRARILSVSVVASVLVMLIQALMF